MLIFGKEERPQVHNLSLKNLEKDEQIKPQNKQNEGKNKE